MYIRREILPGKKGYVQAGSRADCPSELDGYACTLNAGHRGEHVAHGAEEEVLARWDDEGATGH